MTLKRPTNDDLIQTRLAASRHISQSPPGSIDPDGFAWSQSYRQDVTALLARVEAAEGIVTTAQKLMAGLDHVREVRKANKQSTAEVDWAIGATLDLRAALAGREETGGGG